MNERDFNKLSSEKRYSLLKEKGDYLAARMHGAYNVSLFACEGLYIELWQRVGLDYVDYIEVIRTRDQLNPYLDQLDLDL